MMTQNEMMTLVPQKLAEIEKAYNVTVLYAAESGSRAWGFASTDSDFDVRFIYKRAKDDYLRLELVRDVIEEPVDEVWDVAGWDLDKTLRLLFNSNPAIFDWIGSPVCYLDTGFRARFLPLIREYYSRERMLYHYLHMAERNIGDVNAKDTVRPKKYFYALRPVLACQWVLGSDFAPPVQYAELTDALLPPSLRGVHDTVMDLKQNAPEKAEIVHIDELDRFLKESVEQIRGAMRALPPEEKKGWDGLNRFFLSEIGSEQ